MRDLFEVRRDHDASALTRCLRSLWLAVALAMIAIIIAPQAARAEELPTFTIVMKQGRLHPDTLEVPANKRFKLILRNEGVSPVEFESRSLRKEKVLAPGATSFLVIAPQKPGEYDMFDEFHEDTAKGRIIVK